MTNRGRSPSRRSANLTTHDAPLIALMRAIAAHQRSVKAMIMRSPGLCRSTLTTGASRTAAADWFLPAIAHYMNAGDTALHIAAAAGNLPIARTLITMGAAIAARNRLGAQPLHYACDGGPDLASWDPGGQARMVRLLVTAGADPDAADRRGVTGLHRAVRTRCTGAVRELLLRGADPKLRNGSGTTPLELATNTTGRGGSGSPPRQTRAAEDPGIAAGSRRMMRADSGSWRNEDRPAHRR